MAPPPRLLYGPDFSALESRAFEFTDEHAGDQPQSILWLTPNRRRERELEDQWIASGGAPLRLMTGSLDSLVTDCYERLSGAGSQLDALTRRRYIEQALDNVGSVGALDELRPYSDEFSQLIGDIEAAGYDDTDAVRGFLENVGLDDATTEVLAASYNEYESVRDEQSPPDTTIRSQLFTQVASNPAIIETVFDSVDVVVASGFYDTTAIETDVLAALADRYPFIGVLPAVTGSSITDTPNDLLDTAFETYVDLGCEPVRIDGETNPTHSTIAAALYAPPASAGGTTAPPSTPDSITWHHAPTRDTEIRHLARHLRNELAEGTDPESITVVVPGLLTYRDQLVDAFDTYEIPHAIHANTFLEQTHFGRAMMDLVELCVEEPSIGTVSRLSSNPLVSLAMDGDRSLARLSRQIPGRDVDAVVDQLPDAEHSRAAIREFLERTETIRTASKTDTVPLEAIEELSESIGLKEGLKGLSGDGTAQTERRASSRIDAIIDSVAAVVDTFDDIDPAVELRDALEGVSLSPPRQSTTGRVEVMGVRDAHMRAFDHLYLVGLTEEAFPVTSNLPRFFEAIHEASPELAPVDSRDRARYFFTTLLASAETVDITTPDRSPDDTSLLTSSVVDELRRVTDLERSLVGDDPSAADRATLPPGTREDLQRDLARIDGVDDVRTEVDRLTATDVFTAPQQRRLVTGAACAAARADTAFTAHDGKLSTETVSAIHAEADRTPYSPTRLESYAECGFAYYMDNILEFEELETERRVPDGRDAGRLVHQTFRRFYAELQRANEPVQLASLADAPEDLEPTLLRAGKRVADELELTDSDSFHRLWLAQCFAGLGSPSENPYYGVDRVAGVPETGLFKRFLTREYWESTDDEKPHPTYFEAEFPDTRSHDDAFDVALPSGETMSLHGFIDRIDLALTGAPSALVNDYKTSDPTTTDTIQGIGFQLPVYALAAESILGDRLTGPVPPVDATFYTVEPPTTVKQKRSLKTTLTQEEGDRRYDTYLRDIVPERLDQIETGISNGRFQPTILRPKHAGCEYCAYREACDVRHHRREESIDVIDDAELDVYVPDRARQRTTAQRIDARLEMGEDE